MHEHDNDETRIRKWWHPAEVASASWRLFRYFWGKPSGIWFLTTLVYLVAWLVTGLNPDWLLVAGVTGLLWMVYFRQDLTNERVEQVMAQADMLAEEVHHLRKVAAFHRLALEELVEERDD